MPETNKKPDKFQHVDGGLGKMLKGNIVDTDRPLMERMMSGVMLIAARGLLDQMASDGLALPGSAAAPPPLPNALPKPEESHEE